SSAILWLHPPVKTQLIIGFPYCHAYDSSLSVPDFPQIEITTSADKTLILLRAKPIPVGMTISQ
ncbi:MAG TPA: hypothetical protein PLV62_13055, partial [Spirochaetota bacterium]|nr:hypothetical protein [Spirochaetota bacterium]